MPTVPGRNMHTSQAAGGSTKIDEANFLDVLSETIARHKMEKQVTAAIQPLEMDRDLQCLQSRVSSNNSKWLWASWKLFLIPRHLVLVLCSCDPSFNQAMEHHRRCVNRWRQWDRREGRRELVVFHNLELPLPHSCENRRAQREGPGMGKGG